MSDEQTIQTFSLPTVKKFLVNSRNREFQIGEPPNPISNHDKAINDLNYYLFVLNAKAEHHSRMIHDLFHIVDTLINYIESKEMEGKGVQDPLEKDQENE